MKLLKHKPAYHIVKILRTPAFPGHTATWVFKLAEMPWWKSLFLPRPEVLNCNHSRELFLSNALSDHRKGCFFYVSLPKPTHPWAEFNAEENSMVDAFFVVCGPVHSGRIQKHIPQLEGKQFVVCEQTYWCEVGDPRVVQKTGLEFIAAHMLHAGKAFAHLEQQTNQEMSKVFKATK